MVFINIFEQVGILSGSLPVLYYLYVYSKKREDKKNLEEYLQLSKDGTRQPVKDIKGKLMASFKPLFPTHEVLEKLRFDLIRANITQYTAEEVVVFRWFASIVLGVLMALIHFPYVYKMLLFGVCTAGICYLLPIRLIRLKIKVRQREAHYQVLDFIDLVANGMEAGLDLNLSIDKVTRQMPGVLAEEFQTAFGEIELNLRRSKAFKALADRLDVEDVTLLIDAINQAETTGVPMAKVLKDQAQRIRNNYKTNALKMAQAASVKMLVPMILFIVPALFIVVLGPPCIGIGDLLKF